MIHEPVESHPGCIDDRFFQPVPDILELYVTSHRRFRVEASEAQGVPSLPSAAAARIERAFDGGPGAGLLHLATVEVKTSLPPGLAFARGFAQRYVTQLCHLGESERQAQGQWVEPPGEDELATAALDAPPIKGTEYLDAETLRAAWLEIDVAVRDGVGKSGQGLRAYLHERNPLWRLVGRVTFHLAENKRDEDYPFAFLATYAGSVSERGEPRHLPLARALKEYAGAAQRKRLAALLTPIRDASQRLPWVQELIDSGDMYQPLAWTPAEAHRFLRDVPALEESGLVVRIPDWWRPERPKRPQVSVRIGSAAAASLGAAALLDFSVGLTLDGEPLTEAERRQLLAAAGGLVRLRGQWVEADGEKLAAALAHWKRIERDTRDGGLSFHEGMRLLAGAGDSGRTVEELPELLKAWSGIEAGEGLRELLGRLRDPQRERELSLAGLRATLRPYQVTGAKWLALLTGLGLGACLADDMGLGKTLQVIALLLHLRAAVPASSIAGGRGAPRKRSERLPPSLIVAPASLIANWKAEIERFAPDLEVFVAHPSETAANLGEAADLDTALHGMDVALTTYGVVARSAALRERPWRLAVLDEAQAIKNAGAQQSRAVKQLRAESRIALTGTPIENHLSDLWSLFDFLNPGLLGNARAFAGAAKRLAQESGQTYAPLRRLVQPYLLRRLKTDRRVIADLPEKTEVRSFCGLTREQAALYGECVAALQRALGHTEGIQRRGTVLAHLMQLKQICNHPAQWSGQGGYAAERSGKFERLASLCEELAERQERVLVFTQFREMTAPLAEHLGRVFGRPGLILHGGTAVSKRQSLVDAFQREDGPPFFVLSLKAGGTGLNLTAASQVIHFDRWWNPAVENQATDRAFRIGQQRNVLVHKFVCRGTLEEKIDALIEAKAGLARDLLGEGGERLLTEMSDEELLDVVALDIQKACAA
ncbi:MAG: DEAD/DEAH box helicase [Proteobacteria bacterium]|nr:DEAD/DEAH box helicase [Pseudomonadota bacterium]